MIRQIMPEAATKLGTVIAKKALDNGIKEVVFDRGGYIYQGKVKALADAAREAGLGIPSRRRKTHET